MTRFWVGNPPFAWLKSRAGDAQEGLGLVGGRERRDPCPRAGLGPQCCALCLSKRIERVTRLGLCLSRKGKP